MSSIHENGHHQPDSNESKVLTPEVVRKISNRVCELLDLKVSASIIISYIQTEFSPEIFNAWIMKYFSEELLLTRQQEENI